MNSTRFTAFFWVLLIFLFENFLRSFLSGLTPFILMLSIIFYALAEGPMFGFVIGLFGGFLVDALLPGSLGPATLAFSLTGLFCGLFSSKIFRESVLTQLFLPLFSSVFLLIFLHLFQHLQTNYEDFGFFSAGIYFWNVLITVILSPFFLSFLKKVSFVRKERTPWN